MFFASGAPMKNFTRQNFFLPENKSCFLTWVNNFVKRQKIPTWIVSKITGGLNFGSRRPNFEILGPKEAVGGSNNLKNGLCTIDYPYFYPLHASLVLRGPKRWPKSFLGLFWVLDPPKGALAQNFTHFFTIESREMSNVMNSMYWNLEKSLFDKEGIKIGRWRQYLGRTDPPAKNPQKISVCMTPSIKILEIHINNRWERER